jgi:hypothetical protein
MSPVSGVSVTAYVSVVLLALVLLATPTLQLDWNPPAPCPDRAWLLTEIERVHGPLVAGDANGLVAHATVRELRGRWEIELATSLGDASGRRRLSADTCSAAAKAAAVVISLALTHPPAREQPVPPPVPASAPPMISAPAAPLVEEPLPPPSTKLVLAVSATVRTGPLPQFAPGAALTAGLWRKGFQLELSVFTPVSQTVPAGRGTAQLGLPVSGEIAGSLPVFEGSVELDALVGVEGGWARGKSLNIVTPGSGDTAWLAVEGGAALRFSLGQHFWARVEARAGASVLRPRFQLDLGAGQQDLFVSQLFSGRAGVGIESVF